MKSPTYGEVTFAQIANIAKHYINRENAGDEFELCVGTDSQNFEDTKMVMVVTLRDIGHGGIYFYDVVHMRKIMNVREKLTVETTHSLEYAQNIIDAFAEAGISDDVHFCIHVDAGPNGKSSEVINEICGWVRACGYEVKTKPESYAASGVANMISK